MTSCYGWFACQEMLNLLFTSSLLTPTTGEMRPQDGERASIGLFLSYQNSWNFNDLFLGPCQHHDINRYLSHKSSKTQLGLNCFNKVVSSNTSVHLYCSMRNPGTCYGITSHCGFMSSITDFRTYCF